MIRRVVITSVGSISPAGNNWLEFQDNIFLEKDWFKPLPDNLPYTSGGKADDSFFDQFFKIGGRKFKYRRYYNRSTQMAIISAFDCLNNLPYSIDLKELSIFWGAGPNLDMAHMPVNSTYSKDKEIQKDFHEVSAAWLLLYLPNMTACAISCALGTKGETLTYTTACAASSDAIGEAFLKIRNGEIKIALAGGSDSRISREGLFAYKMLGALSEAIPPMVLPFCKNRDGFVPGEGAACFMLMEESFALSCKIPILAEISGYGSSSDGFRLTDPDPSGIGMETSMQKALKSANMTPDKIDLINAHGTGTFQNDLAEASAIKRLFKAFIPIAANKSQIGHLSAASGAIEIAASLAMLKHKRLTPAANTKDKNIEEGINLIKESYEMDIKYILSNSFGFGGQNSTIIIKKRE